MKKVIAIYLNDKNSTIIWRNNFDQCEVKETRYGVRIKSFDGGSHGYWENRFYPWHMIREITYEN